VALLRRGEPFPAVPARALLPGDGLCVRDRARSAQLRPEPVEVPRGAKVRRVGGRSLLTSEGSAPMEIVLPGRPVRAERIRREWMRAAPAEVDVAVVRRLGFLAPELDARRAEVLGDWGYWSHRVEFLSHSAPGSELAALLEERPSLEDAPFGGGLPSGLGSLRAQLRLDSLAARHRLICSLQGDQFADAAALAVEYPMNQEFVAAEVALALGVPESVASGVLATGFTFGDEAAGDAGRAAIR
jgi:hypothetical protein